MTQKITILLLSTILCACSNEHSNTSAMASKDSASTSDTEIKIDSSQNKKAPTIFFIKDSSKYSAEFLMAFKESHASYENVSLIDDTIIINNNRKKILLLPTDLALNKRAFYTSPLKDRSSYYKLWIKRVNYSTIEYEYAEGDKGIKHGFADLAPTFYLESEGTFEDKNSNIYGMNAYTDQLDDCCWVTLLIGMGSTSQTIYSYGCETDTEKEPALTFYRK